MARSLSLILIPPALSILLLAGIVAENSRHVKPEAVEPYHQAAAEAISKVPYRIGGWIGRDEEIPAAAVKLLRTPAYVSRTYIDLRSDRPERRASLLIVQTRDSRDMVGHYPPNCYPANGMTTVSSTRRELTAGDSKIPFTEYAFTQTIGNETFKKVVYDFLVVPGTGLVPDMGGVYAAAEDYQKRYYGAAQFQVVFSGINNLELPQTERDEVFTTLIGANNFVLKALLSGGMQ